MLDKLLTRSSATVRELFEDDHKDLAYTTVMTTLDRLFRKGLLKRSKEGKAFRYRPRFSREELYREAAAQALRLLLGVGSASSLPLSFLVEILGKRDMQLIDDLRELVERKRRLGSCSPVSRRRASSSQNQKSATSFGTRRSGVFFGSSSLPQLLRP